MRRFFIYLMLLLLAGLLISVRTCYSYRNEMNRLSDNQHTLLTDIEFYRTKDSLNAAGVERLTLTNREFRKYAGELERTVADLQLKVRRLQSASRTAVTTTYPVEVRLRDTVIVRDTVAVPDTLKRLYHETPWVTLDGILADDLFRSRIESRDTLIQVVHRVPRKFWFIRWGTKAIRQEIICKNPHSKITYMEYIELKR